MTARRHSSTTGADSNRDAAGRCKVIEAGTHPLEVGELGVLGPVLLSGAAHQGEDLVDLLDVTFALEEGGVQDELPHDAAQAPHVYGCRVLLHSCKQRARHC